MPLTRRDVDVAGQRPLAVLSLDDRDLRQDVQALREALREPAGHVLHDQRRRAVGRQGADQLAQGLDPAG
jgi:hypothetical protein